MKNLWQKGFVHSLATIAYISLVSLVMSHGDQIFGKMDNSFSPIAFLSLFTLSSLVVGVLILGKPIMLYLDNKKKEAIELLSYTIGWMGLFTIILLIILAIKSK